MEFFDELRSIEESDSYRESKLRIELSEAVAKAMNLTELTPSALAKRSGVSHQQILRILDDDHNSTIRTITRLAYAMNFEPCLHFREAGTRDDLQIANESSFDFNIGEPHSITDHLDYSSRGFAKDTDVTFS